MNEQHAREVLERIADGWRTGRPEMAAACFTLDARYLEPPDRQHYVGREELAAFFGAGDPTVPRMEMRWRGIGYDAGTSTAYGEYTFRARRQYHGVVIATFRDDLIASWREYQYTSELPWEEFVRGPVE